MKEAIYTFIREDCNVRAWLGNKFLANKLKHVGEDVKRKISSESDDIIAMDVDLLEYGGKLQLIRDDLKHINNLRAEENTIRQEIATAQEQLEKAKRLRKNLITLSIATVITMIIGIGVLVAVNHFGSAEPEVIENVEE